MRNFFIILQILSAGYLYGQGGSNSPWSRLGLGDLADANFTASASMGRLGATFHDPYMINLKNPASLGFLRATALEVGFFSEFSTLKNKPTGASATVRDGNISHMALGFPMHSPINEALERKKSPIDWGMAIALLPYSRVGYAIESTEAGPSEEVGSILYSYEGTGSTYRLYWGNGLSYKNLSFGLNLQYVFGKISRINEELFVDLNSAYQNYYRESFNINGFAWNVGIMYKVMLGGADAMEGQPKVSGRKSLTFGLYGNSRTGVTTLSDQFFERLNGGYLSRDTFFLNKEVSGTGTLPAQAGFGIMYDDGKKIKAGVDVEYTGWAKYRNDAKPESLLNVWKWSAGLEWIPDHTSYNNFFKRVRYHFGGYYETDPRSLDGEQLYRYAGTVGFGLPIILKQDIAFINIKVESGQFGLSDGLKKIFTNFALGFTLNDNTWFYKRKFR